MKLATLFVAISLPVLAGHALAQGEGTDTAALFASLQADKRTAEQIIVELVNSGLELDAATAYTVANADSIGLAVAYAHAGVCLAEDPTFAEAVAKKAVEGATEQSRNAVEARVTETLANFESETTPARPLPRAVTPARTAVRRGAARCRLRSRTMTTISA